MGEWYRYMDGDSLTCVGQHHVANMSYCCMILIRKKIENLSDSGLGDIVVRSLSSVQKLAT